MLGGGSEHSSVIMEGQKPRNHAVTSVPRTGEGRGLFELIYMSCTRLFCAFPPKLRDIGFKWEIQFLQVLLWRKSRKGLPSAEWNGGATILEPFQEI